VERGRRQGQLFDDSTAVGVRRIRKAFDRSVSGLRRAHALEDVDEVLVAMGRTCADALDDEHTAPEGSRFVLYRGMTELRAIVDDLRGRRDLEYLDDELAGLSAPMGDPAPPGPPDPGPVR
jgi:hypothetical protein